MNKTPYLEVVAEPRMMAGKGAPRSTVFGVLGRTKESGMMRSLGGLVANSKASAPIGKGTIIRPTARDANTERHIVGPASRTHISPEHYAQVPYPGRFMGPAGERLS